MASLEDYEKMTVVNKDRVQYENLDRKYKDQNVDRVYANHNIEERYRQNEPGNVCLGTLPMKLKENSNQEATTKLEDELACLYENTLRTSGMEGTENERKGPVMKDEKCREHVVMDTEDVVTKKPVQIANMPAGLYACVSVVKERMEWPERGGQCPDIQVREEFEYISMSHGDNIKSQSTDCTNTQSIGQKIDNRKHCMELKPSPDTEEGIYLEVNEMLETTAVIQQSHRSHTVVDNFDAIEDIRSAIKNELRLCQRHRGFKSREDNSESGLNAANSQLPDLDGEEQIAGLFLSDITEACLRVLTQRSAKITEKEGQNAGQNNMRTKRNSVESAPDAKLGFSSPENVASRDVGIEKQMLEQFKKGSNGESEGLRRSKNEAMDHGLNVGMVNSSFDESKKMNGSQFKEITGLADSIKNQKDKLEKPALAEHNTELFQRDTLPRSVNDITEEIPVSDHGASERTVSEALLEWAFERGFRRVDKAVYSLDQDTVYIHNYDDIDSAMTNQQSISSPTCLCSNYAKLSGGIAFLVTIIACCITFIIIQKVI